MVDQTILQAIDAEAEKRTAVNLPANRLRRRLSTLKVGEWGYVPLHALSPDLAGRAWLLTVYDVSTDGSQPPDGYLHVRRVLAGWDVKAWIPRRNFDYHGWVMSEPDKTLAPEPVISYIEAVED